MTKRLVQTSLFDSGRRKVSRVKSESSREDVFLMLKMKVAYRKNGSNLKTLKSKNAIFYVVKIGNNHSTKI